MKYKTVKAIINDEHTTVEVLDGITDQFMKSDILDKTAYDNFVEAKVTVPVQYESNVIIDGEKKVQLETRNEEMSRELAFKLTENGTFDSTRYHRYIQKCENL